ncbi:uncharacterized protein LOC122002126 [Zingiber officinale]|nr:uncharacterized protein LOC122002126 [Zingiber officinale]
MALLDRSTTAVTLRVVVGSMDGFHKHCGKDRVRNTMMKQEEDFRFQVHELHRLYRVQRTLMDELERSSKMKRQFDRNPNARASDSALNFTEWISLASSEACDTPLTEHTRRVVDIKRPDDEEAWSVQDRNLLLGKRVKEKSKAMCPQPPWPEEESDLQLTLSIACGTDEKRSKNF